MRMVAAATMAAVRPMTVGSIPHITTTGATGPMAAVTAARRLEGATNPLRS